METLQKQKKIILKKILSKIISKNISHAIRNASDKGLLTNNKKN